MPDFDSGDPCTIGFKREAAVRECLCPNGCGERLRLDAHPWEVDHPGEWHSHERCIERLRARLGGATQFQFWGAGGRRGDYVLVCFNDEAEDKPWEIQAFTCETSGMFGDDVTAFETQGEATTEALRLAATLTASPAPPKDGGGLVPRDEARRRARST